MRLEPPSPVHRSRSPRRGAGEGEDDNSEEEVVMTMGAPAELWITKLTLCKEEKEILCKEEKDDV